MLSPTKRSHDQEPTTLSVTDTAVDDDEKPSRPSNLSATTACDTQTRASTSSQAHPTTPKITIPKKSTDNGKNATPAVIPPEHEHRTLILAFEGTNDFFDLNNSNIVKFCSMLKKDDRTKQMIYYQAGIGTYTSPEFTIPVMSWISRVFDGAIAWNLDAHVMSGYKFLMEHYNPGDKICLFGFSRGAYIARALAGMLHKVGLLPASNYQQVPFAYKMYKSADVTGWQQSIAFKKTFSLTVEIEFLGVWDTVESVGLISRRLPFTTSNTVVRTFRQALSLDEHRVKFQAKPWDPHNERKGPENSKGMKRKSSQESFDDKELLSTLEEMYGGGGELPTDVLEVWFAGCHCDVGGGSVPNNTPHSLARIPLRWMIRECFKSNTGIMFDSERLREIGLDPASLYPYVQPRPPALPIRTAHVKRVPSFFSRISKAFRKPARPAPEQDTAVDVHGYEGELEIGTEEEEDLKDALSPEYDQLKLTRAWWLLEWIPMKVKFRKRDKLWGQLLVPNLGRPRVIPKQTTEGVKVHRSVRTRMAALYENKPRNGKKYVPRANFNVEPTWID